MAIMEILLKPRLILLTAFFLLSLTSASLAQGPGGGGQEADREVGPAAALDMDRKASGQVVAREVLKPVLQDRAQGSMMTKVALADGDRA